MSDTIPQDTPQKQCTGPCQRMLPATLEFFHAGKGSKYGVSSECKPCRALRYKAYRQANHQKDIERHRIYRQTRKEQRAKYKQEHVHDGPQQKQCLGTCGRILPATPEFFHAYKRAKDGLRSRCKECRSKEAQLRRQKNPQYAPPDYHQPHKREARRAYSRNYYQSHKERAKEREKEYRRIHSEAIHKRNKTYYEQHKDAVKRTGRSYYRNNRERWRAWGRNRRARVRNAEGKHTTADIKKQYDRQKGKCYYCKAKVGTNYHVDHVVPLIRGGSNGPENLVISCPTCNLNKNDQLWRLL